MKTVVLYHANCMDGFGAAWAYWHLVTKAEQREDTTQFIPMNYGDKLPLGLDIDTKVVMADFSLPYKDLVNLCDKVMTVVVIDHHKSFIDELNTIDPTVSPPNLITFTSLESSGCRLVWDMYGDIFHVPLFIRLIEDRDLWRFSLPQTKAFYAKAVSMERSFAVWEDFLDLDNMTEVIQSGNSILAYEQSLVEAIAKRAESCLINDISTMSVNCPYELASYVGDFLLTKYPMLELVMMYHTYGKQVKVSLRAKGLIRCDMIAKQYGGGGHANAAGFLHTVDKFFTEFDIK